jgi:putative Mg2+ transporter-C (MgtC) family protein
MPSFQALMAQFWASQFLHTFAVIAVAFALGLAIGFERQWRQRTAGLRTTVLVAVGAAAFAELGMRINGPDGATRIIAYIVSGIGFLGAGVIVKDGTNVRGLNTAATLWCSGAVGAFAGSGFAAEAAALTSVVLAGNTLLRPLVNWINRRPISADVTEAEYRVHVVGSHDDVSEIRDLLDAAMDRAHFPVREFEILSDTDEQVELAALLVPTTAKDTELDAVVTALEASPLVKSATWSVETTA